MQARKDKDSPFRTLYVKALDSMPVGSVVDFTGSSADVPVGWEEVNDYSTTEIDTGKKWTDGSTIYRKVLTGTTPSTSGGTLYSDSSINVLIDAYGFVKTQSSTETWVKIGSYTNNGEYNSIYFRPGTGILFNGNYVLGTPYRMIIEYTKSS